MLIIISFFTSIDYALQVQKAREGYVRQDGTTFPVLIKCRYIHLCKNTYVITVIHVCDIPRSYQFLNKVQYCIWNSLGLPKPF